VRLIGINAPEFGKDASQTNRWPPRRATGCVELVQGKNVRLVLEEEQRDHYGRWLAHLQLPDDTRVDENPRRGNPP